ncbi:hypothetical protein [Aliikangiella coralliicola]|uniref:Cytochrome C oxidase subunit I n=1 Tax=Aliikangiella coralliicola TaxID=2592383 RepID=A0A545UH61_9GAMM|nr:hypothetical protein [Aliikangiella coralliicola]TQV88807.1 hypothetical protein FLL46_04545 [Aliikangiella coralliicola]
MDFEEIKSESREKNVKKNRATMIALFVAFIAPVVIAYSAYFSGWFQGATKNNGELLAEQDVLDIEDFHFVRSNGNLITGREFETLYWWLLPIDPTTCDEACLKLNTYTVNQTYVGLGKEARRINQLLVLPTGTDAETGKFPLSYSEFTNVGVKALEKTRSGLNKDLPANYIYLVDPLGNIFMRYPLVPDEKSAPGMSKNLRTDLLRLFKYSRLG